MRKKSGIMAICISLLMVFAMIPMTVETVFAEDYYTVTIEPGEGNGDAFTVQSTTIISKSDMIAGNYDQSKGCYYLDDHGKVYYVLPRYCSFTAPDGKEFDCWYDGVNTFDGGVQFDIASTGNFAVRALYKEEEAPSTADFTIPSAIDVQYGYTQTAFDIQLNSVTFGQGDCEFILSIDDSSFKSLNGDEIPFTVSFSGNEADRNDSVGWARIWLDWNYQDYELPYSAQGYINIRSEDFEGASPGSYSASLNYSYNFGAHAGAEGTIALTLTVPEDQPEPQPQNPISIQNAQVVLSKTEFTYNGAVQKPEIKTIADKTLTEGTDHTISWSNEASKNAGTYTVTITGKGDYTGTTKATYKIDPKAITPAITLSASSYTWNGKVRNPAVTVKDGSNKLAASDYTVTYASGRKNVGKYNVKVTLKGNYSGTKTVSFKVDPKGTSLKTLKKAKKAATIKWKKQSAKMSKARITGYQILLATDKQFTKNKKTVNVKGYSKVSRKVTKLKGGKKYYVKIRTYKTVGGATYYSPWSKVKTVTTKK